MPLPARRAPTNSTPRALCLNPRKTHHLPPSGASAVPLGIKDALKSVRDIEARPEARLAHCDGRSPRAPSGSAQEEERGAGAVLRASERLRHIIDKSGI